MTNLITIAAILVTNISYTRIADQKMLSKYTGRTNSTIVSLNQPDSADYESESLKIWTVKDSERSILKTNIQIYTFIGYNLDTPTGSTNIPIGFLELTQQKVP